MKKLMLCLVLLSGIYGCCNDIPLYWEFDSMMIELLDSNDKLIDTSSYHDDYIYLNLIPSTAFVSQKRMMYGGNSLYAFSYPEKGEGGLKDKVSRIEVTCNEVYNEIPAGELLNDEINFLLSGFANKLTGEELLNEINVIPHGEISYADQYFLKLELNDKPSDDLEREFTVRFIFDSNKPVLQTSPTIRWN